MSKELAIPTSSGRATRQRVATGGKKEHSLKNEQKFDPAAKARITRAETAKHGQISRGSFGSIVQSVVDRTTKSGKAAKAVKTRQ